MPCRSLESWDADAASSFLVFFFHPRFWVEKKKSEDVEVLAELSSCFLIRDDRFLAAYLHIHFHTIWEILKGVFDQSPTFAKEGFRENKKSVTAIPRLVRTSNSALSISAQKQIVTTPRIVRIINSISAHIF